MVRALEVLQVRDEEDHRPVGEVRVVACGECSPEERAGVKAGGACKDPGALWKQQGGKAAKKS